MRVKFVTKSTQADHLKHLNGGGITHFSGAYGAGLGGKFGHYALTHLVVPAGKGALAGAVGGVLSEYSGSLADKMKAAKRGATRGALLGAVGGSITASKKKAKSKAERPF